MDLDILTVAHTVSISFSCDSIHMYVAYLGGLNCIIHGPGFDFRCSQVEIMRYFIDINFRYVYARSCRLVGGS